VALRVKEQLVNSLQYIIQAQTAVHSKKFLRGRTSIRYSAHLAAHLARAADDIPAAFAASLATLEAEEAFDHAQEAVLCSTSTTQAVCLLAFGLLVSRSRWVHGVHGDSGLGLGGGSGFGSRLSVHYDYRDGR